MRTVLGQLVLSCSVLALSGCGGGGDSTADPPAPAPAPTPTATPTTPLAWDAAQATWDNVLWQ